MLLSGARIVTKPGSSSPLILGPYELCFQKIKRLVRPVLDHAPHRDLRDVRTVTLLCDCPEALTLNRRGDELHLGGPVRLAPGLPSGQMGITLGRD
jgi:hypothetical protein